MDVKDLDRYLGTSRNLARLSSVVGSVPVLGGSSALGPMLARAKAAAPQDVKDGVGTLVGAAVGALVGQRKGGHWVLGAIGGASLGRNVPALVSSDIRSIAAGNLAVTGAGIAGSLLFKRHPVIGFLLGTLAGGVAVGSR